MLLVAIENSKYLSTAAFEWERHKYCNHPKKKDIRLHTLVSHKGLVQEPYPTYPTYIICLKY